MSDFETRVAEALTDGAESAPGASGLADVARRRAGVRRRRRVSVAAAVAVVLVAVPVAVVAGRSAPDERTPAAPESGSEPWTSVTAYGVTVDVPDGWRRAECGATTVVVPPAGRCSSGPRVGFQGGAVIDSVSVLLKPDGGAVTVDGQQVTVERTRHETARRILASARPEGTDVPDLTTWRTVELGDGLVVDTPGDAVEVTARDGALYDCQTPVSPARETDEGWRAAFCGTSLVTVTGPTEALVDVVVGSVRKGTVDGWRTVSAMGVDVDVPDRIADDPIDCDEDRPGWGGGSRDRCAGQVTVMSEGRLTLTGGSRPGPGPDGTGGYVVVGDVAVLVDDAAGLDHETARRILASVRPQGAWVPDLTRWTSTNTGDGLALEVPVDPAVVRLERPRGDDRCTDPGASEAFQRGSDWVVALCAAGQRSYAVGSTRALMDVVGSSARIEASAEWQTVTAYSTSVDVPADWVREQCAVQVLVAPPGGLSCRLGGEGVLLSGPVDGVSLGPSLGPRSGNVSIGGHEVTVAGASLPDVRRVLASARPAGTDAPDIATWRRIELEDGITAEVPADPGVDISVSGAIPSCTGEPAHARQVGDAWQVGLCRNRIVTVTAPTQALADVVALQVEGY